MNKKYEFTGETKLWLGRTLKRIRAVISFGTVGAGEIGGWIEKEENLSHEGKAWVCDNAKIWGDAWISGNAEIWGNAEICDNAKIFSSSHYLVVGPIGSRYDFITFCRGENKEINVKCGCFRGNIDEFSEKVKETHGDSKHAKVYFATIQLAKEFIDLEDEEDE